ncbi:cytochrome c-type biogenesis protein CcmH, partial [Acidobacteria bacterium AH-259-O06]|nr:cytochrome c-type biogenesis protein CcmH [Acidobacteria bacterium AH-259-O06]
PSQDETVSQITRNLMCSCGCPHIIKQCGDECGLAPELVQEITRLVAAGKTQQEVYANFEAKYGPSVRAVPTAEGFNLLVWIVPFVGLFVGVLVVIMVVKKLKPDRTAEEIQQVPPKIDKKYRRLLDRELKR